MTPPPSPELTVSAQIPVYAKVKASDFSAAVESIFAQIRAVDELVIIADGPLTPELDAVIAAAQEHAAALGLPMQEVRLPTNQGAGPARNAGLAATDCTWVLFLDSDDIAAPQRLATQLAAVEGTDIVVLGSAMAEFDDDAVAHGTAVEDAVIGIRSLPETPQAIAAYLKLNSPLNQPSVLLHAATVRDCGGYQSVPFMEDYDLWARLVTAGYSLANHPEPLTYFRTSPTMMSRRGGWSMIRHDVTMQRRLVGYGVIGWPRAVVNIAGRAVFRLMPTGLLQRAYRMIFHKD